MQMWSRLSQVVPLWRGVWALIAARNLNLLAAGVAFFGLLAVFPAIAAVMALWGLVADRGIVAAQFEALAAPLPDQVAELLVGRATDLVSTDAATLGWAGILSLLLGLWATRAGVGALIAGMNTVYGEVNRSGLRHMATAFALTFLLILLALVSLAALVGVPVLLALLPLGPTAQFAAGAARWCVAAGTMILALGALYRIGPNRRGRRVGWISPGAVLATLLWAAATWGFSIYLANFGNYNKLYGSLGAVIVLLLWLYLSGFVCLLGAALNAQLERAKRQDRGHDAPA